MNQYCLVFAFVMRPDLVESAVDSALLANSMILKRFHHFKIFRRENWLWQKYHTTELT
jgi:hypothetical protein